MQTTPCTECKCEPTGATSVEHSTQVVESVTPVEAESPAIILVEDALNGPSNEEAEMTNVKAMESECKDSAVDEVCEPVVITPNVVLESTESAVPIVEEVESVVNAFDQHELSEPSAVFEEGPQAEVTSAAEIEEKEEISIADVPVSAPETNEEAYVKDPEPQAEAFESAVTLSTVEAACQVPEEIVETFSLSNQKLKLTSEDDVSEHVLWIKRHPEIRMVALDGNTIGVAAAKALAEAIDGLTNLEEFYLNDCFTGRMKEEVHVCVEAFAQVLKTKSSLKKVDFSDNAFGPVGAKAAAILLSEASFLQELILNNNGLGPEGGKIIAQALLDCQKVNVEASRASSLRRVEIGRNRLENGSSLLFSEALKAHGLLEELALPQNGIRPEGICELSQGIALNPKLVKVNLQDNTFTLSGSQAFAKALQLLPALQTLNIGDCLLGNEGCILVVDALIASGCPIESVNLQYNDMSEEGVVHLTRNLVKLPSVLVLMLNGNSFSPTCEAAEALKEALQSVDRAEILDSWSDMDYASDDEELDEGFHLEDESDGEKRDHSVAMKEELSQESRLENELNNVVSSTVEQDDIEKNPALANEEPKAEDADLVDQLSKLEIQHDE